MMKAEEEEEEICAQMDNCYVELEENARPLGVLETFYQESSDALLLEKMTDCRNPDLNTIDHGTMAELIKSQTLPYFIIDCRFDYEFDGGHIKGAMNLNSPLKVEEFFFKVRD